MRGALQSCCGGRRHCWLQRRPAVRLMTEGRTDRRAPLTDVMLARKQQSTKFKTKEAGKRARPLYFVVLISFDHFLVTRTEPLPASHADYLSSNR